MANKENILLLSKYQMRVLYYKCKEGLTHAEIAEKLDREVNTVQYHMTNIYTILGIKMPGKSKEEMDAELKNEICSIIREMFNSYEDLRIWAPQPQYKSPPSLKRIISSAENHPIPPEIIEPPPPGIRRINWQLIIGCTLFGLLIIIFLKNYPSIFPEPTSTPIKPIPTRTAPPPDPTEVPTLTTTLTSIPPQTHIPTSSPSPTPTSTEIVTEVSDMDGMVMIKIPAGEFNMGSTRSKDPQTLDEELPRHIVYLDSYWIDQTEVTNKQYALCVASGACSQPINKYSSNRGSYYDNPLYADYPVIYVNWNQADAYCVWAGRRLPTEAEWEMAARGPEGHIFPWGNTFDGSLANYCDINCNNPWKDDRYDDGYTDTSPVGDYPAGASEYGVLDMAGNIYEWVFDWYGPYSRIRQSNPTGFDSGVDKIIRGGSWGDDPAHIRSAIRSPINPNNWVDFIGFRCALDPD